MASPSRGPASGPLFVAGAGALWGTIGIAAKGAFHYGIAPVDIALWRAGVAFLTLLAVGVVVRRASLRIAARDVPLFAAYGLIGVAIFITVYLTAIRLSTVATAAMLLYTAPAWVTLLARLVFREPLSRQKVVAVLASVAGSALVVRAYDPAALRLSLGGVLAGLAAGLSFALYSIFGKHALRRYDPFTTTLYQLGFGALFLLLAVRRWPGLPSPAALPVILYLVAIPTTGYLMYLHGLRTMEAGRASIVATVEPVVAALLGVLLLSERLDGWQWVGGALVLSAVLIIQRES